MSFCRQLDKLFQYPNIPLFLYSTIPLPHYPIIPLFLYSIIPLPHYFIIPIFHYPNIPLFHHPIIPLFHYPTHHLQIRKALQASNSKDFVYNQLKNTALRTISYHPKPSLHFLLLRQRYLKVFSHHR